MTIGSPPAGPGENRPIVVDQIIDAGSDLYRVHVVAPDGTALWVQIPAGRATLEFVRLTAAAYGFLITRGLI